MKNYFCCFYQRKRNVRVIIAWVTSRSERKMAKASQEKATTQFRRQKTLRIATAALRERRSLREKLCWSHHRKSEQNVGDQGDALTHTRADVGDLGDALTRHRTYRR